MNLPIRALAALVAVAMFAAPLSDAGAQSLGDRLKKKAQERVDKATESAAEKTVDKAEQTVKCAVTDKACADRAAAAGKTVETTGAGATVTPAGAAAGPAATMRPGEGAWANYDFVPGTQPLYVDDFIRDNVGDFPRRMEFQAGALEIVEWNGARYLRASARSVFHIVLPSALPQRYTMEFDFSAQPNNEVWISFGGDRSIRVEAGGDGGMELYNHTKNIAASGRYTAERGKGNQLRRVRILVDGAYAKVYVNEKRILNVPNAELGNANKIMFEVDAETENPSLFGNFSLNAGGRKLYDAIAETGRVATQGIFFDTGSDVIKPESSPTLKEIASMMNEHADLSLIIEGHTDNVGNAAVNLALSEKRAAAVKAALVGTYAVDAARLATKGLGDTKPATKNDTAEGRQQNRRVELVRG
ncbi:MAG: OmpA family protein [Gemmatimonadaceae bacterium]|nr:OmpA family protein [Gemmatimonadaceae bacterium]